MNKLSYFFGSIFVFDSLKWITKKIHSLESHKTYFFGVVFLVFILFYLFEQALTIATGSKFILSSFLFDFRSIIVFVLQRIANTILVVIAMHVEGLI